MGNATINHSDNYESFKVLDQNREINHKHVTLLKKSIEANPKIMESQPILVNENMEIIDGQHRYQACKELEMPVYYMVIPGLTVAEARSMNAMQRGWTAMDYAQSYAKAGNENYALLLEFKRSYPSLTLSVIRYVCSGTGGNGDNSRPLMFRTGNFAISRDTEDIEWILSRLDQTYKLTSGRVPLSIPFVSAFITANDEFPDFKCDDFINNLARNPGDFHRTPVNRDALRMIEDIHNRGKSSSRVKLY